MPHHLLIRLSTDGAAAWIALERDGRPLHGERAGLPPAPGEADSITVLVPTEDVLVLPVPELPGSARQRLQALPFAIEEQLAAPVEQQHVVLVDAPPAVFVVARERMDGWLSRLQEAGVVADRVLPDGWLLPASGATLLLDGARALLRLAPDRLLALPVSDLSQHLGLLSAAAALPSRLGVLRTGSAPLPAPPEGVTLDEQATAPDLLSLLAPECHRAGTAGLLQHAYAPRHRQAGPRRAWALAAGLAGAALLLAFAHAVGEQWALEARWEAQQADMQALYRSVVPGSAAVPDPAARLRSLLERRGSGGAGGALDLLARVAPALSGSGRFTVDAVEYRGGALELTLRAPDVATLDSLRARLAADPPLQAELTGLVPGSHGVEGRLRVRPRGPA